MQTSRRKVTPEVGSFTVKLITSKSGRLFAPCVNTATPGPFCVPLLQHKSMNMHEGQFNAFILSDATLMPVTGNAEEYY